MVFASYDLSMYCDYYYYCSRLSDRCSLANAHNDLCLLLTGEREIGLIRFDNIWLLLPADRKKRGEKNKRSLLVCVQ